VGGRIIGYFKICISHLLEANEKKPQKSSRCMISGQNSNRVTPECVLELLTLCHSAVYWCMSYMRSNTF
jgi:hypothetical protein